MEARLKYVINAIIFLDLKVLLGNYILQNFRIKGQLGNGMKILREGGISSDSYKRGLCLPVGNQRGINTGIFYQNLHFLSSVCVLMCTFWCFVDTICLPLCRVSRTSLGSIWTLSDVPQWPLYSSDDQTSATSWVSAFRMALWVALWFCFVFMLNGTVLFC